MNSPFFDTHFHLDLYPDPKQVARQIESDQVYTIAVTNTPSVFEHTAGFTKGLKYLRPALGLHPELAAERAGELTLFGKLLPKTNYVGEVGLDYTASSLENRRKQRRVFEHILCESSEQGSKILTIHSRRASEDVVDMLEGFRGTPVLHWYSGSKSTLRRALGYGCYFSVNPAMIQSRKFEALLSWIPRERLLTETDGPFVKTGKDPAMPHDTRLVVRQVSELWGTKEEEVRETLFFNFRKILESAAPPPNTSLQFSEVAD